MNLREFMRRIQAEHQRREARAARNRARLRDQIVRVVCRKDKSE